MRRRFALLLLIVGIIGHTFGQDAAPTATPQRRSWLGRVLHPFSSEPIPRYKDPRFRGLGLDLQITPQTIKLSEVPQLAIKVTVTNQSKRPIPLDFPTNQRIGIYFRNSTRDVLSERSDTHAIA